MATAELPRPGVEVIQAFRSTSPTIVRPTLVPFVTGAAKEIVEVTTSDGTLNTKAKQGTYGQLPRVISQSAFPSPRSNIAEVNVEEGTIKTFLLFGGSLLQLERDPGESFLAGWNKATRPATQTKEMTSAGLALDGKVLVLAIDVPARLNTTKDVTIALTGATPGANLTAENIRDQINAAMGATVASIVVNGANKRVQITSTLFGAAASVTVRGGASANPILGYPTSDEVRIEGSGFRAQDLSNNTTVSPWVEWTKGTFLLAGVKQSALPAVVTTDYTVGLVNADSVFAATFADDIVSFLGTTIDLKVGDQYTADGVAPNGAFVMKVEAKRFKLGTLNTTLSTFDANGKVVNAVYDPSNVQTLFGSAPFAPRYSWFQAKNLVTSTVPQAAVLTGSLSGQPAELAVVKGTAAVTTPASLAGLTIIAVTTVDGVEGDSITYTFTGGPFAAVTDIANAINTSGVLPDLLATVGSGADANKLIISTIRTGAGQAVTIKKEGTANTALNFSAVADTSDTGKDVEFVDVVAAVQTSSQPATSADLGGLTLIAEYSTTGIGGAFTQKSFTFGASPQLLTRAQIVAALNTSVDFDGSGALKAELNTAGTEIIIRTTQGGDEAVVRIPAIGGNTAVGATLVAFTLGQQDQGEEHLTGYNLKFKLNDRPHVYETLFLSNSLVDAVAQINETVGFAVASIGGTLEDKLVITSPLKGYASKVEVVTDGTGSSSELATFALGFGTGNRTASGTGRPNPDFALDVSGNVVLSGEILRHQVTGQPFDPGSADIYIQYTGLRRDVSPEAESPALLRISDTATLQTVLGPLTSANPLGLGMFFQLINAPGLECAGLGVDEVSGEKPWGTPAAFSKVGNFIESEEIYAIAPLTDDETVIQIMNAHAAFMSAPEQKGERIVIGAPPDPVREVDTTVASGLSANTTATANELVLDVNPAAALLSNGVNAALPIPVSEEVFVEITVDSVLRRYSVQTSNGVLTVFRTTFASGENDDDFYSETPLNTALVNADWAMKIRGNSLLIPGSTLLDKDRVAATVATRNSSYKNRRFYSLFPDRVKAAVAGPEEILPSFYAAAAIAGMTAAFPPQQGFTNLPMTGFTGVLGSNDTFSTKQLNVMAGGGTYTLVQEAQGAPLISRHQLSTNTTTIETREMSITKVVDFTAKFLRTGLRNFIGTFNITQPFLDTLSTVIHGMLKFLEENGIIISGDLNNIIQSKEQPDTVLVDVTLNVPFPCNYIRLTLAI